MTPLTRYDSCSRPINSWFILRSLSNENPGLFVLIFYLLEHVLFTYVTPVPQCIFVTV